jgi:ferritin-like metal-binding protein YciE
MNMAEQSAGDQKLVQYLNEAYGLEKQLETALQAHIAMTEDAAYKKRLKQHLTETKRHARDVSKRVKALGGTPTTVDAPGPAPIADAAQVALNVGQKAVALTQGPLHALRGTGIEEKQLKNAKTEYASEAEEIATYTAIETVAELLGDTDTRRLAKTIRLEEERMRAFLEKTVQRLAKDVVKAEVPAAERKGSKKASSSRKKSAKSPQRSKAPQRKVKRVRATA